MEKIVENDENFQKVCKEIDLLLSGKPEKQILVAIDGHCASGKSTLGEQLRKKYDATLIHMDDFYPQKEQRTPKRMKEIGGHIDYERFEEEVLAHIKDLDGFEYRPLIPPILEFGEKRKEPFRKMIIMEGAYSQHPRFGDIYDLRIFYDIDPEYQLRRILIRNGPEKLIRFKEEWIPKENLYLETFKIKENSLVLMAEKLEEIDV